MSAGRTESGVTAGRTSGCSISGAWTAITIVERMLPDMASICAIPGDTAVTVAKPGVAALKETVATARLVETQVSCTAAMIGLPRWSNRVATTVACSPTVRLRSGGRTWISATWAAAGRATPPNATNKHGTIQRLGSMNFSPKSEWDWSLA